MVCRPLDSRNIMPFCLTGTSSKIRNDILQVTVNEKVKKKMITKIEAEIEGNFKIEMDMKFKHVPFDIDVRFDITEEKYFISISKKMYEYESFLPEIIVEAGKLQGIYFPSLDFIKEQIEILQHIESFGAIDKEIEKINWQNCSIEWIPETNEEEKILPIRKYNRVIKYESEPKILSKDWLRHSIIHKRQLAHLALPFSFFREGANLYRNSQYQTAFMNFYLMLEGFFGNGKDYKNEKIKLEFSKSKILEIAINKTINNLIETKGQHYEWIEKTCKKYNKKRDVNGVIHFLVEQRGNLSHFSLINANKQKNPFKEKDYHSLAFVAMMICIYSSINLRLDPFRHEKLSR